MITYEAILIPWFIAIVISCIGLWAIILTPAKAKHPWAGRKRLLLDTTLDSFLPYPGEKLGKNQSWYKHINGGNSFDLSGITCQGYKFSNDILDWLDWHLEKYPDAILPKQEAVFVFETDSIKSTTTLFNGQDKQGIDLLKETKKLLSGKVSHGNIPVHKLAKIADGLGGGNGKFSLEQAAV